MICGNQRYLRDVDNAECRIKNYRKDFMDNKTYIDKLISFLSDADGLGWGIWGDIAGWTLVAVLYLAFFAVAGLYLVLMERKVAAWIQLRKGPNRVGPWGLFQTIADALKLVSKELTGTIKADKFLYNLAPYFPIVGNCTLSICFCRWRSSF